MVNYDKNKLRHYIDVVSFAVDETKLFLDTHPNDKEALEYFEKYNKARNQAVAEYSAHFGPLVISEVSCDREFNWATQPWPWEMEG